MKLLNIKMTRLITIMMLVSIGFCNAQEGSVVINQDKEIAALLDLKKDINTSENNSDRYKIQIYSGKRVSAEKSQANFKNSIGEWHSKLVYETPNYKVWVGSFRTRLEADRALKKIQRKFPSAFIFNPPKKDNE